jgi:predicted nucleotide-binding protein
VSPPYTTLDNSSHFGEDLDTVIKEVDRATKKLANRDVFIVHGHDEARKYELKNFLIGLGLNAIILHEQDSLGKTIIEKFEYYASRSNFAFILMTPDDPLSRSESTESKWRARQNVIMELGWFMAKLGRQRVVILYKGELEIPSDILGVVYHRFNENITEAGESIRQSLKGAGLIM